MSNPNRTRDHLANERTFLAWVRTAMGLIGLGFVVARMGLFLRQIGTAMPGISASNGHGAGSEFLITGVAFLVIGTALAGMSAWLHDKNRRAIDLEDYRPSRLATSGLAAVVVAGGLVLAALVVWRTSAPPMPPAADLVR